MAKTWLVLWYRGVRIVGKPLNETNRLLVKELFGGTLFQTDSTGTEHWAVMRHPKQSEIKGKEFDEEHENVPANLQHLVYDGCGHPSGDRVQGSVRPTESL